MGVLDTVDLGRLSELPGLSAEVHKFAGLMKQSPEDFIVEEIPAYEPCGHGNHVYLWIEKRGVSAEQLLTRLAKVLGISRQDIGMAGMKDRQAVTRQFVSVPTLDEERLESFNSQEMRILASKRHSHKLRTGHLRGNRFCVFVRDVPNKAFALATSVKDRLLVDGFPNYFGNQRFGRERDTLETGLNLLRGKLLPSELSRSRRKFILRLALSSVQAALFNHMLAERIEDGLTHRVVPGDVMQRRRSKACFLASDVGAEQQRFENRETVVCGPMFGPKMKTAAGKIADREANILRQFDLHLDDFKRFKKLTCGTRRAYLVWPEDLTLESEPDGVRFRFDLPSGTYATTMLREFITEPNAD